MNLPNAVQHDDKERQYASTLKQYRAIHEAMAALNFATTRFAWDDFETDEEPSHLIEQCLRIAKEQLTADGKTTDTKALDEWIDTKLSQDGTAFFDSIPVDFRTNIKSIMKWLVSLVYARDYVQSLRYKGVVSLNIDLN